MGFRKGGVSAEAGEKVGEEWAISWGWHDCGLWIVIGELALANMYVVLQAEWRDMSGCRRLLVDEISRWWVEVAMAFFNPTKVFKAEK